MISVIILTSNEEINIGGCLESLSWADDVVVLDSLSCDRTVAIAEEYGARVIKRRFDGYASQRNFGLQLEFKYDWILMIDADERICPDLHKEIVEEVNRKDNPICLYRVRRKDHFFGKWIKHSSGYPTWFGRVFRKGCVTVEREINEEYHTNGEVGFLHEHLTHYPFNRGVTYWLERHNSYSSMEASRLLQESGDPVSWKFFFGKDPALRRKAFKQVAYRMPFRPLLTFCFLYVFKGGLLDGSPGFHFSLMRSIYEYFINLKIREIKRAERKLPM